MRPGYSDMKLCLIFLCLGCCVAKKGIVFESAEITYMDERYGTGSLYSNKYNATTFLVNAVLNFTKDIPDDVVVAVDIFKLSDNTYKKTALSIKKKMCQFLGSSEMKLMWSPYMEERFNIPKKCPFRKGIYICKDIDPNMLVSNGVVNFLPSWSIKVEVSITNKNEPFMKLVVRFKMVDSF